MTDGYLDPFLSISPQDTDGDVVVVSNTFPRSPATAGKQLNGHCRTSGSVNEGMGL